MERGRSMYGVKYGFKMLLASATASLGYLNATHLRIVLRYNGKGCLLLVTCNITDSTLHEHSRLHLGMNHGHPSCSLCNRDQAPMILSHPSFSGTAPSPQNCVICQRQPFGVQVHSPEYPLDYDAKSKISYGDKHGVHNAIAPSCGMTSTTAFC